MDVRASLVWRFAALTFVLCCIPGPAVLVTASTAVRRGLRAGLATACGILVANASYFLLSGAGVAALLAASPVAFATLKFTGAAYLAFLGLRTIVASGRGESSGNAAPNDALAGHRRAFAAGLATQFANPKAVVFFLAVVPQFVAPRYPFAPQLAVLTAVSTAIEFGVLTSYCLIATRVRRAAGAGSAAVWFERAGGAALVIVAATIAFEPLRSR